MPRVAFAAPPVPPDLAALFPHVDAALHLVARASGELGSAGSSAFDSTSRTSPLEIVYMFKRFMGQRRAKKALQQAAPHLQAIARTLIDGQRWLATMPRPDVTLDLVSDFVADGIAGVVLDDIIHDRIETQVLELNNLLDELGRLHAKLRARGFGRTA
jgi:hypothetical protein